MTTFTPAIQAHNLTFSLRCGTSLLAGLDFTSTPGLSALIGKNGSGKSTLARLLSGQLTPENGSIIRHGRVIYLSQHGHDDAHSCRLVDGLGLKEKYNALRRIERGHSTPEDFDTLNDDWLLSERIEALCSSLKLPHQPDMLLSQLSGGERMRVRIHAAITASPDFLILDEPTNHLDQESRHWLQRTLREHSQKQAGVLVISHDVSLLNQADNLIELTQGKLLNYGGNYQSYREQKENEQQGAFHRLHHAKASYKQEQQQRQKSLEKSQKRTANAHRLRQRGGQAKILLDSAKERSQHTLNRLSNLSSQRLAQHADAVQQAQKTIDKTASVRFDFFPSQPRHNALCVAAFNLVLPHGQKTPITFTLSAGDTLWLQGTNGSGKSTLLNIIAQQLMPVEGSFKLNSPVHWLSQQGFLAKTCQTNALEYIQQHCPAIDNTTARTRLAQAGLYSHQLNTPIHKLSGGEQVKLAMLRVALQPEAGLLLLDEPDNHLDLEAKQILAQALTDYPGAAILISHDPDFAQQTGFNQTLSLTTS